MKRDSTIEDATKGWRPRDVGGYRQVVAGIVLSCFLGACACAPNYYERSTGTYQDALQELGGPLEVCLVTRESVAAFGTKGVRRFRALGPLHQGDYYARWVEPGGESQSAPDGSVVNVFQYPILVFDRAGTYRGSFQYEYTTTAFFAQPDLPCPTSDAIPLSELQYTIAAENAFLRHGYDDVILLIPQAQHVHQYSKDKSSKPWLEAYPYLAVSYWRTGQGESAKRVLEELAADADDNEEFWASEDRRVALVRRLTDLQDLVPPDDLAYYINIINRVRYLQR